MISAQIKNRLQLKSKSATNEDNCPRITSADLCSSNTPFSTVSAKLNVVEKQEKKAMSSTLPSLSSQKSGRALKNSCVSTRRSNSDSHSSTDVRMSVSAGHEKLKIAIAKSMPRPMPKERPVVKKKPSLPSKKDYGSGSETSDCEGSPFSTNVKVTSMYSSNLRSTSMLSDML